MVTSIFSRGWSRKETTRASASHECDSTKLAIQQAWSGLASHWSRKPIMNGDPTAVEILDTAARELALLAVAVRGQLFQAGESTLVTYSGGVFRSRIVLSRFRDWMASEAGVQVQAPAFSRYGGAVGALLEAYRAVGLSYSVSGITLC